VIASRPLLTLLVSSSLVVSLAAPVEAAGPGTILFGRNMVVKDKSGKPRERQTVWLMRGDGTEARPLRPRLEGYGFWIAGGRRIAVELRDGRIVTVSRRGRSRRVVRLGLPTGRENRRGRLAWAPNGRSFAFDYFARRVDTTKVFVRSLASGSPRELPLGETELLTGPTWSPDGRTIAATGKLPTVIVHPGPRYETRPRTVGVWLLDPAGGDPRRLATWPQLEYMPGEPAWSPTGREIAVPYYADNPGSREDYAQLLLIDARTGAVRRMPRDPKPGTFYENLSWSPNGQYLSYNRGLGLWVMNARTGRRKNLVRSRGVAVWSPDSRRIACGCAGRPGIWTLSLTGKYQRLIRAGRRFTDFVTSWSPR